MGSLLLYLAVLFFLVNNPCVFITHVAGIWLVLLLLDSLFMLH